MKLELDRKEVEKILLEWAEKQFPSAFNDLSWDYNRPARCIFEFSEATAKDGRADD